jgi:hypothetical protein
MPSRTPDNPECTNMSFYDLAHNAIRAGYSEMGAAIQLSDKIARYRDTVARLSLKNSNSAEKLVDLTARMRVELSDNAQELSNQWIDNPAVSYRIAAHVAMQGVFMDQLVLTPALFSYGPKNEEARTMRQVLNTDLYAAASSYAQSLHLETPSRTRSKQLKRERPVAIREAIVLAVISRAENPDEQILPVLFATDQQMTHAEYFGFGANGAVQQAKVHTAHTTDYLPEAVTAPGYAVVTSNDLGLGADRIPWRMAGTGTATLIALKHDLAGEGDTIMGTSQVGAAEGILQIQNTVSGLLRSKLCDYDFSQPTIPPL